MNSLDPKTTSDGKPYGPFRYKEIVKECYWIAKNCNTPYTELLKITPTERNYLIECIKEELDHTKEAIENNRKNSLDYHKIKR